MRAHRATCILTALLALGGSSAATAAAQDTLLHGFQNPPDAAKPRVWWHWLNGNVTEEGIRLDLEWMRRVGVGRVNIVQASFADPSVVESPARYFSPTGGHPFRYALQLA